MSELKTYFDPSVISDDWKIPEEERPSLLDRQRELWRQMGMPHGKGKNVREIIKTRNVIEAEPRAKRKKAPTQCSTRPNQIHTKQCEHCGTMFTTQYRLRKYCGEACKRKARYPKKEVSLLTCLCCEKLFKPRVKQQKYCSVRCRRKRTFKKYTEVRPIQKIRWDNIRLDIAYYLLDNPQSTWSDLALSLDIDSKTKRKEGRVYKINPHYRQLTDYLRLQKLIERSEKRIYRDRCPHCGATHRNISNKRENTLYRCPNNHTYAEYEVVSVYEITKRGEEALAYYEQENDKNGD